MRLALFLGDMLKTMVSASKKLEAELAMAGHPSAFPSTPKATTPERDTSLQNTFVYSSIEGECRCWRGQGQVMLERPGPVHVLR